jgi:hypothetical protein
MEDEIRAALADPQRRRGSVLQLLGAAGNLLPWSTYSTPRLMPGAARLGAGSGNAAIRRRYHFGEALISCRKKLAAGARRFGRSASPEALEILRRARSRPPRRHRQTLCLWLEEAIAQVEFELRRKI